MRKFIFTTQWYGQKKFYILNASLKGVPRESNEEISQIVKLVQG
jgi:hypothetical protein